MEYHTNKPEVKDIVNRAFPEYTGRDFVVKTFDGPMQLRSYWDEGSKDYWVIMNLANGKSKRIPENGSIQNPKVYKISKLPPNFVVVNYFTGRIKRVTVYVGQENLTKMLPAPNEVSWYEKVVLSATRSLKSSYAGIPDYRFYQANKDTGITKQEWDQAKQNLISKGMLNRAGAITNDGRNAIGHKNLWALKSEKPV